MKWHLSYVCLWILGCMCFHTLSAQTEQPLPSDPGLFITKLVEKLNQTRSEEAKVVAPLFEAQWRSGEIGDQEKQTIIMQVNQMIGRKSMFFPEITHYVQVVNLLKRQDTYVKLQPKDFFEVTDQCIKDFEPRKLRTYLIALRDYIPEGNTCTRKKFEWHASMEMPRLYYLEIAEGAETYKAPCIQFKKTDLSFRSDNDSTLIKATTGDFNLLTRTFVGLGGTVDWAKMEVPSAYCQFKRYRLNFNFSGVFVDSVTFYYPRMISDKPIVGRFEDKNVGFKDVNKAEYPYFRSYGGGIVMENLIPGVSYKGGFSLKGIRTIGSSYDTLVKYVAPKPLPPKPKKEKAVVKKNKTTPVEPEAEEIDDIYTDFGFEEFKEEEALTDDINWDAVFESESSLMAEYEAAVEENPGDTETPEVAPPPKKEPDVKVPAIAAPVEEVPWGMVKKRIPAIVDFSRNGRKAIMLRGDEFVLDLNSLTGNGVETWVFMGDKDTLFHPGMDFKYMTGDKELIIKRPKRGVMSQQPFRSTYHDFYLFFETIIWTLNSDIVSFTAFIDQENKIAVVESFDYFNQQRFDSYKNVLKIHPLGIIYRFTLEHEGEPITPESIVRYYGDPKVDLNPFKSSLQKIEGAGYITYDKTTFEITPLQKLFDWVKAARKKKDYDAIQLIGKVESGDHALMDMSLDKLTIKMSGVKFFALSDSQFVRVVPKDEEVTILKDRNLTYGGMMAAGKLNFYSSEPDKFRFEYDGFDVYCDNIDSMRFILVRNPPEDYVFTPLQIALRNTSFEKIKGKIHIDDPANKNGAKDYPYYPVFDTYEKSYVYWEKDNCQEGIYKKEKLFFALDPFVLDSLMSFDERSLTFDGSFFSSDIFPEFRQALIVMPDNSLGLRNITDPYGMDLYGRKGKFYNEISMDLFGLHGNGKIEYLESTAESDTFTFHFDSCFAKTKDFKMRRSYHIPEVAAKVVDYKWLVKEDKLVITTIDEPLQVFGGEGQFTGTMIISPKGVLGKGKMQVNEVSIASDSMIIDEMSFSTFDGTFALRDNDTLDMQHFVAEHVKITYDVLRHETQFESSEPGVARAWFPIHQYRASLTKGKYDHASKNLKMEALSVYPLDNYFVSVNPKQDSLTFTAKEASYNLDIRVIDVSGVPVIIVADALITPPSGNITIYPDGFIKKIENATIEADKESKFHKIYNAKVNIYSSKQYNGSGMYDYITVNGRPQFVKFDSLHVDQSRLVTIATGPVSDEQNFYLTDRIRFRGRAELDASRKFLAFEGEVKIESENEIFRDAWFAFEKTVVNPDSIFIPIAADLRNAAGEELTVGLNFEKEYQSFYSNFLQSKQNQEDLVVLSAAGGLTIDRKTKEFKIGTQEKLNGKTYKGTVVAYDEEKNTITSSGMFNTRFHDFNRGTIVPKMSGAWKEDLNKHTVSSNLAMGIDFSVLPNEPIKKFVEMFLFMSVAKKDINFSNKQTLENLAEFLDAGVPGDVNTKKFEEEIKNVLVTNDLKIAKDVKQALMLTNVNFNYSQTYRSLYSGSEVGFVGINGESVNKMINSKIVWQFGRENDMGIKEPDKLTILLEVDNFNYLYLEFFEYSVKFYSSYMDDVNTPMKTLLDKQKVKSGEMRAEMGTADDVANFRKMFKEKYVEEKK